MWRDPTGESVIDSSTAFLIQPHIRLLFCPGTVGIHICCVLLCIQNKKPIRTLSLWNCPIHCWHFDGSASVLNIHVKWEGVHKCACVCFSQLSGQGSSCTTSEHRKSSAPPSHGHCRNGNGEEMSNFHGVALSPPLTWVHPHPWPGPGLCPGQMVPTIAAFPVIHQRLELSQISPRRSQHTLLLLRFAILPCGRGVARMQAVCQNLRVHGVLPRPLWPLLIQQCAHQAVA